MQPNPGIRLSSRRLALGALIAMGAYLAVSYFLAPAIWRLVEHRHPALSTVATRAVTAAGIPGDPLNIAFVGSEADLHRALLQAAWNPADPITCALRVIVNTRIGAS